MLNFYILPIMYAIFCWWMRMFIFEANDAKFLIQLKLSITPPTIVCGAIPVEKFGFLALFLAVISVVVEHDQVFARVSRFRQQNH